MYVKGCEFLLFTENIGKNLSNKYSQKLLDSAKKSTTDVTKTTSKIAIKKTEELTGDLTGNKIADKTISASKRSLENVLKKDEKFLKNSIARSCFKGYLILPIWSYIIL